MVIFHDIRLVSETNHTILRVIIPPRYMRRGSYTRVIHVCVCNKNSIKKFLFGIQLYNNNINYFVKTHPKRDQRERRDGTCDSVNTVLDA